jgi:proteasome assembly chaperone (PAC2) family protein
LAATSQKPIDELKKFNLVLRGDLQIAGLNGLFLGAAKERKIEGVCLLGEVPMYATRIPNPKAALAVADALTKVLEINIDLNELTVVAKESEEEMKKLAAEAMGEFIDRYTRPVWPPEEEEEDIEEEEEGNGD